MPSNRVFLISLTSAVLNDSEPIFCKTYLLTSFCSAGWITSSLLQENTTNPTNAKAKIDFNFFILMFFNGWF